MFFLCEIVKLRWLIVIFNTPFASVSFYVCDSVDAKGVLLVNRSAVYVFACRVCLLRGLVLDKSKAERLSRSVITEFSLFNGSHPSVCPSSLTGMKNPSSLILPPCELSLPVRNFCSLALLASGTLGRPSTTTKASSPCSSRTSYCSRKSAQCSRKRDVLETHRGHRPEKSRSSAES